MASMHLKGFSHLNGFSAFKWLPDTEMASSIVYSIGKCFVNFNKGEFVRLLNESAASRIDQ